MRPSVILSIVLGVCNVFLLLLIATQNEQLVPFEQQADDGLVLISGKEIETEGRLTLYLFFHADGECGCLDDWPNWVDLCQEYEGFLNVKGIFNGGDEEKFLSFAKGVGLPFPLYRDRTEGLRKSLRVPPYLTSKLLVDPNGEMLIFDCDQAKPQDQSDFTKRVKEHLKRYL